jgi:hypothetical protein
VKKEAEKEDGQWLFFARPTARARLASEGGRAAEILAEHGVTAHAVRKFLDARLPMC